MRRKTGKRYSKPIVDTPLNYGWTVLRQSDIDGAKIYGLDDIAEIRRSFNDSRYIWIGNYLADGEGFEFDTRFGTLAELTAKIRYEATKKMVARNEPATIQDDLGLMGTR